MIKKFVCSLLAASALGAAALIPAPASGQMATVQPEGDWQPNLVSPMPADVPAAEIHGETMTMFEIQVLSQTRPLPLLPIRVPGDLPRLRGDDLTKVLKMIGAYDVIAETAREAGHSTTDDQEERLEEAVRSFENQTLYQEAIASKLADPTEEDLKALYEEQREERFQQQETLRLAHIIVSTYEEYTVQEGDTLESIAEEIAGDASLADRILSNETKLPRIEMTEKAENADVDESMQLDVETGDELPPRALIAGEELLVPATGEKVKEAEARIQEAYKRLQEGVEFREVAEEFSEAANPGQPLTIRPARMERDMMPELRETFMTLEDGAFSEPIRTKHGFQIVNRVSYTEEGYRPFEEVKGSVERNFRMEQQQKVVGDFFSDILNDEDLVTIHSDAIESEDPQAEDVLITIDGEDFERSSLNAPRVAAGETDSVEEFKSIVWNIPAVQSALLEAYKEDSDFASMETIRRMRELIEASQLALGYMQDLAEEEFSNLGEEALMEYYEENKESRYRVPASYELLKLEIPAQTMDKDERDEFIEEMQVALEAVNSIDDFRQMAEDFLGREGVRRSEEAFNSELTTLAENRLKSAAREVLRDGEYPGDFGPILVDEVIHAYWVQEKTEETFRAYEEVEEQIQEIVRREQIQTFRNNMIRENASGVAVTVLYSDEKNEEESGG